MKTAQYHKNRYNMRPLNFMETTFAIFRFFVG